MNSLAEMARSTASNIRRVIQEKAQIQIDEARLKLETHVRILKQSVQPTVPYIVVTGLDKVPSSFKRLRLPKQARESVKQSVPSIFATEIGREVRSCFKRTVRRGKPVGSLGRVEKWNRDERSQKRLALWLTRQRKIEDVERRRSEEGCRKWLTKEKQEPELGKQYVAWLEKQEAIKKSRSLHVKPSSEPAQDVPAYEESHEERRKFIDHRLAAILGPERMKTPALLPSGHNPMDPVIAQHNEYMYQQNVLNQWESHKAEQRRQAEEAEATRQQIQGQVKYYRDRYILRLEKLVSFGTPLARGIDHFEAVMLPLDEWEAASIVHVLTWQILNPIQDLLNDCAKEIPLEHVGAQELKNAWPMERMEDLLTFLQHQYYLPGEIIDMGMRLDAVLKAVYNPTPFVDPLAPKPTPVLGLSPTPGSGFANLLAGTADNASEAAKPPTGAISASPGSGLSKLLAATAEKLSGGQSADSGTPQAAASAQVADSPQRTAVLTHVNTNHINLMDEAGDLINRKDGKVSANHRRQVESLFKQLLDDADGCEHILERNEGTTYRSQVKLCKDALDGLSFPQTKIPANKNLRKQCDEVMRLWK